MLRHFFRNQIFNRVQNNISLTISSFCVDHVVLKSQALWRMMMKTVFGILYAISLVFLHAEPFQLHEIKATYADEELTTLWDSISDIRKPSHADYLKIQNYLQHGRRPYLDVIFDHLVSKGIVPFDQIDRAHTIHNRVLQKMQFVGPQGEMPIFKTTCLGDAAPDDKSRCIILFSSYNQDYNQWDSFSNYADKVNRLISELHQTGFKGHVVYRIGGFPLEEKGGVRLIHVPYAFKLLSFIEASQMGYDEVLWVDLSMHPTNDLSSLFTSIKDRGYLLLGNDSSLGYDYNFSLPLLPDVAVKHVGVSVAELDHIPHVICTIVGLSFRHQKSHDIISEWLRLTALTHPAMTLYPEEFIFSIACWRTANNPTTSWHNIFSTRSSMPVKPSYSDKPFWFDKG
jgi:hypothetical protein